MTITSWMATLKQVNCIFVSRDGHSRQVQEFDNISDFANLTQIGLVVVMESIDEVGLGHRWIIEKGIGKARAIQSRWQLP